MKYTLITSDGDRWEFDNEDEARRNQWIFGGTVIKDENKIKEVFKTDRNDLAIITKENDKYNPYKVEMKISFADYESARSFIEQSGFTGFKKIERM